MRKRFLKKSDVLREGYLNGLRHAQRIINEMLEREDACEELHSAIQDANADECERLLGEGADPNDKGRFNFTPLCRAAYSGNMEICEMLLNAGADAKGTCNDGHTALHWAAYNDMPELCEMLLKKGADVDATENAQKLTPLHMAAYRGNTEVCKYLLYYDADIDLKDKDGKTPLRLAAEEKHADTVKLLKDYGGVM